jgi:transposase InsO family protein
MTLEDRVQAQRLFAFQRAAELHNVSAACRELGLSRALFYRWKRRVERYGADGLHPRRTQARRGRPPQVPAHVERTLIGLALAWPTWGPQRLATQLGRQAGIVLAPSTIYRALRRAGLGTRSQRLLVLEHHSASRAGLLTQRTRRTLENARRRCSHRHVEASAPGELVCLDCFYVGKLKGVGKVWQITACDAASSYAMAHVFVLAQPTAQAAARFLQHVLVPHYRQAGWPIQRVLTDGGSEFKGDFDQACRDLHIRHTRTQPRHAWTNGFVERLQGTILHEHWRVEFRRRYFTRLPQLQRSLDSFLRFYNHDRPHHGYRTRGRTPAAILLGARER